MAENDNDSDGGRVKSDVQTTIENSMAAAARDFGRHFAVAAQPLALSLSKHHLHLFAHAHNAH